MIYIIMGPPGSGKGTQSSMIRAKYGMYHISTGDIIRNNIKEQTKLGVISKGYIDKGQLVPDDLIIELVEDTFDNMNLKKDNLLLDGYPRTVQQAKALDNYLNKHNLKIELIINLDVPDSTIILRTIARRTCSNEQCKQIYNLLEKPPLLVNICDKCGAVLIQREDDYEQIVKERLSIYHNQTRPILEYYRAKQRIFNINGEKQIMEIANEIVEEIEENCRY